MITSAFIRPVPKILAPVHMKKVKKPLCPGKGRAALVPVQTRGTRGPPRSHSWVKAKQTQPQTPLPPLPFIQARSPVSPTLRCFQKDQAIFCQISRIFTEMVQDLMQQSPLKNTFASKIFLLRRVINSQIRGMMNIP